MRSLVLTLFIFGLIPFILTSPYFGLLVWSWIGYMNPHRLTYGFAYDFPWVELIAIITLISLIISRESKRIPMSSTVVLMALLLAWTTLTTILAVETSAAWGLWEKFAKILILVGVTLMLVKDKHRMHYLVWIIAASIGFYGVKGGLFTLLTGGSYHVLGPTASFFGDNNGLALALCMTVPLLRYLQLQSAKKYMRIGLGMAIALTCIAVLGTYSRGGFIGLAVVVLALAMKSRRRMALIMIFVVLAAVGYQFMPAKWTARMDTIHHARTVSTVKTRIQSWEFAINVARARPLVGGGFYVRQSTPMWNTYAPKGAQQRAIHSIYFRVLGEHGFPGLALFLGVLFFSWRNCAQIRRRTRENPSEKWAFDLASMFQVSLLVFMIEGAATTLSYFDLTWQLMAMTALLHGIVLHKAGAKEKLLADAGHKKTPVLIQNVLGLRENTVDENDN
jgi:probable O-glycosylation ligase (exosortase A-associated)